MDQVRKPRVAAQGIKVRIDLDQLQDVRLFVVSPLKPAHGLLVVTESQISVHKGGAAT